MTCQEERYQNANKEKVVHHFRQLLEEIIPEPIERISTNIPEKEREARFLDKKYISETKKMRKKPSLDE